MITITPVVGITIIILVIIGGLLFMQGSIEIRDENCLDPIAERICIEEGFNLRSIEGTSYYPPSGDWPERVSFYCYKNVEHKGNTNEWFKLEQEELEQCPLIEKSRFNILFGG